MNMYISVVAWGMHEQYACAVMMSGVRLALN